MDKRNRGRRGGATNKRERERYMQEEIGGKFKVEKEVLVEETGKVE